jgi:hypothetical protein
MKTNLLAVSALLLGLGLGFSQGANASIVVGTSGTNDFGTFAIGSNSFDVLISSKGDFDDVFTFTLPKNSSALDAEFSLSFGHKLGTTKTAGISDSNFSYDIKNSSGASLVFDADTGVAKVASGVYSVEMKGATGNTAFSDVAGFNHSPIVGAAGNYGYIGTTFNVSPVPEAEEWAMMIVGLGLIGVVAGKQKEGGFKIAHS